MNVTSVSELLGELVATAAWLEERANLMTPLAEKNARVDRLELASREAARLRGRALLLRLRVEQINGKAVAS